MRSRLIGILGLIYQLWCLTPLHAQQSEGVNAGYTEWNGVCGESSIAPVAWHTFGSYNIQLSTYSWYDISVIQVYHRRQNCIFEYSASSDPQSTLQGAFMEFVSKDTVPSNSISGVEIPSLILEGGLEEELLSHVDKSCLDAGLDPLDQECLQSIQSQIDNNSATMLIGFENGVVLVLFLFDKAFFKAAFQEEG